MGAARLPFFIKALFVHREKSMLQATNSPVIARSEATWQSAPFPEEIQTSRYPRPCCLRRAPFLSRQERGERNGRGKIPISSPGPLFETAQGGVPPCESPPTQKPDAHCRRTAYIQQRTKTFLLGGRLWCVADFWCTEGGRMRECFRDTSRATPAGAFQSFANRRFEEFNQPFPEKTIPAAELCSRDAFIVISQTRPAGSRRRWPSR